MDDWKSPSMAKENIAAVILSAKRVGAFGSPSSRVLLLVLSAEASLASRGAFSARELDAMFGVKEVE
jgi:hypothetical protein